MMRILAAALAIALASCTTSPTAELAGNEPARRETYRSKRPVSCRDLRAPAGEEPYLNFVIEEPARIADLRFTRSSRYERQAIPHGLDTYGPYKGEEVLERDSPYFGANEFKITSSFYLYLPDLAPGFEKEVLARDRDTEKQNGAAEVAVRDQRYASIVHLRCRAL